MIAIKNYGSRYYVTSEGKVFSKSFEVEIKNQTGCTGKFRFHPEKELRGGINTFGYRQVLIDKVFKCVHRIVAECFLENPNNLPEVNHKDGDKLNNSVVNLEWCTRSHNIQHSYDTGLNTGKGGVDNGGSVLTEDIVVSILQEYATGTISQESLGIKYGVSQVTVSNIIIGRTWNHISKLPPKRV